MTTLELAGIAHELRFWRNFVKSSRFLDGWVADIPTPELNEQVREFILDALPSGGRILDVGSGVVSILHGLSRSIHVDAVDPLGELYGLIFDYAGHGLKRPMPLPAEELPFHEAYEIVHISNALDHCQAPDQAYKRLMAAVKPGGWLIIQGFKNEAEFEKYAGFHQFNISYMEGVLIITDKNRNSWTFQSTHSLCGTETLATGKTWIIWVKQK